MNLIFKTIFGSHLYGTDSESSDKDYKGIFLPTLDEVYLGKILKSIKADTNKSNTKNTSEDEDIEIYSLHYFIELACKGETVALDMLHAPANCWIKSTPTWERLVENREMFYTKNLSAFIGYARRQASKYGIKGSRLNAAKEVMDFLKKEMELYGITTSYAYVKLEQVWDRLPTGEHIHFHESSVEAKRKFREYEVCGRRVQETATLQYAYEMFKTFHDAYGHRAREAAQNKNVDWKAVSHAIRAAFQVKEIMTEGTIIFPLKEAGFIKQVKNGKLDYTTVVAPKLEELIDECEVLSAESSLPEKVNRVFWNNFIIDVYKELP